MYWCRLQIKWGFNKMPAPTADHPGPSLQSTVSTPLYLPACRAPCELQGATDGEPINETKGTIVSLRGGDLQLRQHTPCGITNASFYICTPLSFSRLVPSHKQGWSCLGQSSSRPIHLLIFLFLLCKSLEQLRIEGMLGDTNRREEISFQMGVSFGGYSSLT
jgi:hypothetical protein